MGTLRDANGRGSIRRLVGLRYEVGEGLPTILFKAAGDQADAILARQERSAATRIVRDADLARALHRLPIDAPIGRELFDAVAAVLVHVFSLEASLEASADV